jgi:DNA polymerase III delta subunit
MDENENEKFTGHLKFAPKKTQEKVAAWRKEAEDLRFTYVGEKKSKDKDGKEVIEKDHNFDIHVRVSPAEVTNTVIHDRVTTRAAEMGLELTPEQITKLTAK